MIQTKVGEDRESRKCSVQNGLRHGASVKASVDNNINNLYSTPPAPGRSKCLEGTPRLGRSSSAWSMSKFTAFGGLPPSGLLLLYCFGRNSLACSSLIMQLIENLIRTTAAVFDTFSLSVRLWYECRRAWGGGRCFNACNGADRNVHILTSYTGT